MPTYDTLIRHARIIDGSGNPWTYGDVALAADRIAAIAPPSSIPQIAQIQSVPIRPFRVIRVLFSEQTFQRSYLPSHE